MQRTICAGGSAKRRHADGGTNVCRVCERVMICVEHLLVWKRGCECSWPPAAKAAQGSLEVAVLRVQEQHGALRVLHAVLADAAGKKGLHTQGGWRASAAAHEA